MKMKNKSILIKISARIVFVILSSLWIFAIGVFAQTTEVSGRVYEFDEKGKYDYSNTRSTEAIALSNTYGAFTVSGEIKYNGKVNSFVSYTVNGDSVALVYEYSDKLLKATDENWHLIEDKSKTVADIKLDANIGKGTMILQTSKDGRNWLTDLVLTNVFEETPNQSHEFYKPNSVQLSNGCFYRLIVAYEKARKVGESKILFVTTDEIEYKKVAEVYEFYLHDTNQTASDFTNIKTLGSVVNTGKDNGYSEANPLDLKDPHYGWTVGEFFISGYTRDTTDNGTPVFLKNVGDQITLWFNLKQDINKLNGDENLVIANDTNGYDKYFQTAKTDMGRGTLIIRYTDEKGVKHDPEIYTNYLEANARTSADTIVKLFEEGDYEIALDYEIKSTPRKVGKIEVIPEYTNYRIFFEFAVRNGNCMVFPFDIKTGSELTEESITENGFRLDMAKSRYLTIDVTRSVVTMGANGYTEDIRFNRPAKDGDQYTDEGIYSFSVKNLYTGESTTKKIYVGSTDYMKALSLNKISVTELNDQISQGGIIETDGTITLPPTTVEAEDSYEPTMEMLTTDPEQENETQETIITDFSVEQSMSENSEDLVDNPSEPIDSIESGDSQEDTSKGAPVVPIVVGSLVVLGGATTVFATRKKKNGGMGQ